MRAQAGSRPYRRSLPAGPEAGSVGTCFMRVIDACRIVNAGFGLTETRTPTM